MSPDTDTIIEEQEYREQLHHADRLIGDLIDERDQLQVENSYLRSLLGIQEAKHVAGQESLIQWCES